MDIRDVQKSWDHFGTVDPMWAVLTYANKMGNQWEPEEFFATGKTMIDLVMKHLDNLGASPSKGNALDFGCGVGRLTQALTSYFENVDGVDIAPSMIEQAKTYNQTPERCHYHLNFSEDLSLFQDATFDFALTLITLQHVETRYSRQYLKEFLRVLKPGGILLFQIPSEPTRNSRIRRFVKGCVPGWVLNQYRRRSYGDRHEERMSFQASMEMYGIPRSEVMALMEENGGETLSARPDELAGNWISYTYCVRKRR